MQTTTPQLTVRTLLLTLAIVGGSAALGAPGLSAAPVGVQQDEDSTTVLPAHTRINCDANYELKDES